MLLTRETLMDRLDHHLKTARQIDVAVAWAGDCDALDRLCAFARRGGAVRAIVGIAGNATNPNAFVAFRSAGNSESQHAPSGYSIRSFIYFMSTTSALAGLAALT